MLKYLVENGSDVTAKDKYNHTVEYGADVNPRAVKKWYNIRKKKMPLFCVSSERSETQY